MIRIEKLDWDSAFFGFDINQITLNNVEITDEILLKVLGNSNSEISYIVGKDPFPSFYIFSNESVQYKGTKIEFRKVLSSSEMGLHQNKNVTRFNGEISDSLERLVYQSGEYSRFNLDVGFKPMFKKFYREWIEQSIIGNLDDAVFVYIAKKIIQGFVTVKISRSLDLARIGLIAVSPSMKRSGIGSSLIRVAETYALSRGVSFLHVTTQGENMGAIEFYKRNGFRECKREAVCHYWHKRM